MAEYRAQEVQAQVTNGHRGVAKETESLPRQDESALVFFSLLWKKNPKQTSLEKFLISNYKNKLNIQDLGTLTIFIGVIADRHEKIEITRVDEAKC